jgi:hypothetical protein
MEWSKFHSKNQKILGTTAETLGSRRPDVRDLRTTDLTDVKQIANAWTYKHRNEQNIKLCNVIIIYLISIADLIHQR